MTTTLSGVGTVALGREMAPFVPSAADASPRQSRAKKLIATSDYFDNILSGKFLFARNHLDALHRYLASCGVTRHQWIVDTIWNFYDERTDGFDLLSEATESAHRHGLEFFAEVKPFEGGGFGSSYPHSMPFPEDGRALRDIRGIYATARPFVAENPQFCLQRRPGTYEAEEPVSAIRLVKQDDRPTRIKPEHLTIWTSRQNNGFERYNGPVSFRESVEWRPVFPVSRECRIIHLEGLQIPEGHRYILIRCRPDGGDFSNERGRLVEATGTGGSDLPLMMSTGPVAYDTHRKQHDELLYGQIVRYFQHPDVNEEFTNREKAEKHYRDFYSFDERVPVTAPYSLSKEGYVAVACGKPKYMPGNLHPVYPEVRTHWLDMIRFCLERGVDGVNIRHSNHTRSPEDREYGFNDAVVQEAGGLTNYAAIRRVNGNAYTGFLREARDLVKRAGKTFVVHLYSQMLMPDDRPGRTNYLPPNFEWQWKTWIDEIADELEFRGAWTLRPENLRQVLETFSAATREARKPFYFQGNMKELRFNGPFRYQFTANEIAMVQANPDYAGFVLYETANFTRMKQNAELEGSPYLEELLKRDRWEK